MCTMENGNDKIDAFSEDYANNIFVEELIPYYDYDALWKMEMTKLMHSARIMQITYLSNVVTKISIFDDSGMRLPLSSSYKPETFQDENK